MKKIISTILSTTLLVLMLFTFVGCDESAKFVGTWECSIDWTDEINQLFAEDEDMGEYIKISEYKIKMLMTFKENGTYSVSIDEEALDASMETLKSDLQASLEKYFEAMLKEEGLDMTLDELFEINGTSLEEMIDEMPFDDLIQENVESTKGEGNFKAEDGKLFLSKSLDTQIDPEIYDVYEITGSTLKLLESVGDDEADQSMYPMEFKKIS